MRTETETPVVDANASLRARIEARAKELSAQNPIILPVPGCEDLFAVEYRVLNLKELTAIALRQEEAKDDATVTLVDTLLKACVTIREVQPGKPEDEWRDTGFKWGSRAARDLFGLDLPEGTTERSALLAIFEYLVGERHGLVLAGHCDQYSNATRLKTPKIAEGVEGESTPARAGI